MQIPIYQLTDFNMKMSELIKILEDYKKSYGDCQVWLDGGRDSVSVRMELKDFTPITAVSYKVDKT